MIISKTPLRMSFVGGGSDLPGFYSEFGGAVVSTAINKYIYVSINKKFGKGVRLAYSKNEEVESVDELEHRLVRHALKLYPPLDGVEITTIADVPAKGTGLGSSSSFTVGFLHALASFRGETWSKEKLADQSCHLEINVCGEPIGKQDQYAAAYGGLNFIEFMIDGTVSVSEIGCSAKTLDTVSDNCLTFYTGIQRSASAVLKDQSNNVAESKHARGNLQRMVTLARELRQELEFNRPESLGEYLHENWMLKKTLSSQISSDVLDEIYIEARNAGATGGKLLGAGVGGFLLFYVPKSKHQAVKKALSSLPFFDVSLDSLGSQIVFSD